MRSTPADILKFFSVITIIWFALNFYLFVSVNRKIDRRGFFRYFFYTYLTLTLFSFPFYMFVTRLDLISTWLDYAQVIVLFIGYIVPLTVGYFAVLVPHFILYDLFLLVINFFRLLESLIIEAGPIHRLAKLLDRFSYAITAGIFLFTLAMTLVGFIDAMNSPKMKIAKLKVKDLDQRLDKYTIVQISDTHIVTYTSKDDIEKLVSKVEMISPDLIVITGDFFDGYPSTLKKFSSVLSRLPEVAPTVFVTGNHEYFWDVEGTVELLKSFGFTVLINDYLLLEYKGAKIEIVGTPDDAAARNYPEHLKRYEVLLDNLPEADIRIHLAHRPTSILKSIDMDADILLSGHTHGGQFYPWTLLVPKLYQIQSGVGSYYGITTFLSVGSRYWFVPLRTFNRGEVVKLVLSSE